MTAREEIRVILTEEFADSSMSDDLLDAYRDEVRREIVEDLYAKSWEVHDEEHFGFLCAIEVLEPGIHNRVNEENRRRQSESGTP